MKRIAVLNSGGDSPGMNACVASVVRSAALQKIRLTGIIRGYNGIIRRNDALVDAFFENGRKVVAKSQSDTALLERIEQALRTNADGIMPDVGLLLKKYPNQFALEDTMDAFLARFPEYAEDYIDFDLETILDINNEPGSYLRTARCDDFRHAVVRLRAVINLAAAGVEGLVVIGGDGSFRGATLLCQMGMPCIGIPGTIDNDLDYTEMTLGYDTAVNVCMRDVIQIRSTSRAHDRPHVVEVMGRDCGDIAVRTAMATGAEIVAVREVPWSVDEIAKRMQTLINNGNRRVTVVVSEGAYATMEPFDLYAFFRPYYDRENESLPPEKQKYVWPKEPMTAHRLAEVLRYKCIMRVHPSDEGAPAEVRATVLGYTQRGEIPSAYDAVFAYEAGIEAVRLLVHNEQDLVIGIKDGRVYSLPINEAFRIQDARARTTFLGTPPIAQLVNRINSL